MGEMQRLMYEVYGARDFGRGVDRTLLWLFSEVGEMADEVVKGGGGLAAEAADVLAWLLSLCNVACIDLERAFHEKYGGGCPKCRSKPCSCPL